MGSRKELSKDLRNKVMKLYKDGKGYQKISKALQMPVSTIQSFIKKWKIQGSLDTKPRSGIAKKISAKTVRRIVRDTKKNPQVTSGEIQAAQEKDGVVVSSSTIQQYKNKKIAAWSSFQKEAFTAPMPQKSLVTICLTTPWHTSQLLAHCNLE
uniref:Sleeping Beauty transposase HTH domain-containing protein n=1 Tax=Esox lucius TaxID=8010 RepID=A0AAY5KH70_ESOLU